MTMRAVHTAIEQLIAVGYAITPYPDSKAPTNLIVRLGERTVTTLAVLDEQVDEGSVDYLVSEQHYAKLAEPRQ